MHYRLLWVKKNYNQKKNLIKMRKINKIKIKLALIEESALKDHKYQVDKNKEQLLLEQS